VAIGQSTGPSERVLGNLFYRGLVLLAPVFIGDTLRTRTEVVALKQNRAREDGSATGLVVLRVTTENQHGESVLDFSRCPMIPLRDGTAQTGRADRFETIPEALDAAVLEAAVPADWDFAAYREACPGGHLDHLREGSVYEVEGRDTVTAAPELARLTLNVARAHTDAGASAHGRRLAYGGHTIGLAAAHAVRALPNLVTVLAWQGCDHLGPVFEGDVLRTELTVEDVRPLERRDAGLVGLRAVVRADRGGSEDSTVLDWSLVGLMA
jgi:acyl dehydratase